MIKLLMLSLMITSIMSIPVVAAPSTVTDLQQQKRSVESEVNQLQAQLDDLISKTNILECDLIDTGNELLQAKKDLKSAEKIRQKQYDDMKMRIKYMYENNDTNSVLERILKSRSITELLNEMEYTSSVHSYDRDQLSKYEETVEQITELKTMLEEKQAELEQLQDEYAAESETLRDLIQTKQGQVSDLDSMIRSAIAKAVSARSVVRPLSPVSNDRISETMTTTNSETTPVETPSQSVTENTPTESETESSTDTVIIEDIVVETPPAEDTNVGSSVVDRAYGAIGLPYVWGATGPNSFDCSGLVGYCLTGSYNRLGTTYTFMTWPQVSDPQPGDICTTYDHCGVYIGNGQMIHAPHSGDYVKISPVQSDMIFVRW